MRTAREALGLPTAIAILAILLIPQLFVVLPERLFGPAPALGIEILVQALYFGVPALVIWIVIRWERLPVSSIGLRRPTAMTLANAVLLFASLQALPLITTPLLDLLGTGGVEAGLQKLARLPLWFRVVVGLTGGVIEELLYRGYLVERLASATGRRWLGATLAAVVFGLAHSSAWGIGFALGADLPFGIVMTLFYLWRRDLIANMLAHSAGLVIAMIWLA
jgi:membrane protease YdiL (CAAX protease family)